MRSEPAALQQVDRTYVLHGTLRLSYFSGCDYYRMSTHPQLQAALVEAVGTYGVNVAASRMTTGNHALFRQLEERIEDFFEAPSALLTPTGYTANLITAQALAGEFTHALVDERAHASMTDAARFLGTPMARFRHHDPADLAAQARECGAGARLLVLTDGLCARDGSAPPLAEYLEVLPRDARLWVDDAHGAGVLGKTGQGAPEHSGIPRRRVIQTITLSKAFGAYGGAVLSDQPLRRAIMRRSALFIGSTPPPLPLVRAAIEGVKILKTHPQYRSRLNRNSQGVRTSLRKAGLPVADAPGPVFGLTPVNRAAASALTRALLDAAIFPPFVKYPGGPRDGYFRFVISSEHTTEQLAALVRAVASVDAGRLRAA